VKLEHGKIESSLAFGIAKIDVGAGLDKEIHNDMFIELTGFVQEQAPVLLQSEPVFDVKLCKVYVCFLIGILRRKISLHPRIKRVTVTKEFHAGATRDDGRKHVPKSVAAQ